MKTLLIADFLVVVFAVYISAHVTAPESILLQEGKNNVFHGKREIIGNVNSTKEINRTDSQNSHNNKTEKYNNGNNNNSTFGVIPTWIATQAASSLSSSVAPALPPSPQPPPLIRARTTKLLERPLESQLISQQQFHESKGNREEEKDSHYNANLTTPSTTTTSTPLSPQSSFEKRHGSFQRRRNFTPEFVADTAAASPPSLIKNPTVVSGSTATTTIPASKNNKHTKRQDGEIPEISEGSPTSEIEFTSFVSPIESSLGGLTGLQGLPPLSPVQFVKLLVAVTPFIIPLIFIPLLLFSIGLLMIPVTRANVFVGVGDVRSPSSSLIPSFISSYVVNPIKSFSSGGGGASGALMALPRSIGYDLGTKLVDTEQCVERISCEISARYLHSHWEQGNWRSIANTSWISRIMSYLGQRYPTVSRIAKSLQVVDGKRIAAQQEDGGASNGEKENDKQLLESESGSSSSSTRTFGFSRRIRSVTTDSSTETCRRYTCQPKSLLRKFLAAHSTKSR